MVEVPLSLCLAIRWRVLWLEAWWIYSGGFLTSRINAMGIGALVGVMIMVMLMPLAAGPPTNWDGAMVASVLIVGALLGGLGGHDWWREGGNISKQALPTSTATHSTPKRRGRSGRGASRTLDRDGKG